MASISSVSGSSSIYGNKNIISGLASGLDTESMIEKSVSGYKAKINALMQRQSKTVWQQNSFHSIINKMSGLTQKYTSYTSSTNLFSSSYFDRAVTSTPQGANASAVSATGKTNSNISIDSIRQLASKANYLTDVSHLGGSSGTPTITAKDGVNLEKEMDVSTISGSMSFTYGNRTVEISFSETDIYETTEDLAAAIEEKLSKQTVTTSSGSVVKASELIKVDVDADGKTISFSDAKKAGNSVYIKDASDNIQETLGLTPGEDATSLTVEDPTKLAKKVETGEYLSEKTMEINLDGIKKTITLPKYTVGDSDETFMKGIQASLDKAFGKDAVKVADKATDGNLQLEFTTKNKGSTLAISSTVGEVLGFESNNESSYLNTSKTLGDLNGILDGLTPSKDKDGNEYYSFVLNDVEVGRFTKDTALESVILAVNNSSAGVTASYSKVTNELQFNAKETGSAGRVEFGAGLADKLFGPKVYDDGTSTGKSTAGKDAVFTGTINGKQLEMTRSTNVVNLEGLNVSLNSTFGHNPDGSTIANTEKVTFSTKTDSDTIINGIKSFVEDYNAMVKEIREAYRTMPAQKTNGSKYEPLTEDDKTGMSESEIKAYEDKVKEGILFGDSDLSALYSKLTSAITPAGGDGGAMRTIGISTSYSDGLTTLTLDETKLRSALEANPDSVKQVFAKSKDGGAETDGLMQRLKTTLDIYGSTSLAGPGVLVTKAGTPLVSATLKDNALQKSLSQLDKQIESWQTKMSSRVDYYTRKFTALEQMMAQMNSQSSSLAGLMGGSQ